MHLSRQLATPAGQLLAFFAGAAGCTAIGIVTAGFVIGLAGGVNAEVSSAFASAIIATLLLALSAFLLRRQRASLVTLGLPANRRRLRELAFGFAIGSALFFMVAWTQSTMVGAPWEFQGVPGAFAAMYGLIPTASMVFAEELLFRGVALRALRGLYGDAFAVLISGLLFGAYHLVGSGDWAMGAAFRFLTAAFGGVLFGWAAVRSEGLALPIGLHLGGNWVQAKLAAFTSLGALDGSRPAQGLWHIAITPTDLQRLTAPDLSPHLPYFAAIAVATIMTSLFLRTRLT